MPAAAQHRGPEVRPLLQQGGRDVSNNPSSPPDDSEVIEAELVGEVVVLRIGFSLRIPHERARCETVIAFPSRMLFRVIAAIHGAVGK